MIYLASSSPRRAALLKQAGVDFAAIAPHIDEEPYAGEEPVAYVVRMAREKAVAGCDWVRARHEIPYPVLAADTIVLLDGKILHKPDTQATAQELLRHLSGRVHTVYTALCLDNDGRVTETLCESRVSFKDLSDAEIAAYGRTGEPLGKAGGYAIQGRAALFVRRLEGSYSGVMGLPLYELGALLGAEGLL